MRYINYRVNPNNLTIQITGQSHKKSEFGIGGLNTWTASNGVVLKSYAHPAYYGVTDEFYVAGDNLSRNNETVRIDTLYAFSKIHQALEEYNRYFADEEIPSSSNPTPQPELETYDYFVLHPEGRRPIPNISDVDTPRTVRPLKLDSVLLKKKEQACIEDRGAVLCKECLKKARELMTI